MLKNRVNMLKKKICNENLLYRKYWMKFQKFVNNKISADVKANKNNKK